ncbi:hypothetical protein RB195_024123 [Necator americanus]|uniref:Uncharacterized protein n=1 Tax=Necator americanus TaxID=51031 RepID=A0ABR1EP98_NECAM
MFTEVNILSDSEFALAWTKSSRKLLIFVTNQTDRIAKMRESLTSNGLTSQFLSCTADTGTRGVIAALIYDLDWIRGPHLLVDDRNGWPLRLIGEIDTDYTENGCKVVHHINIEVMTSSTSTTIDLSRFSSLMKALRTLATVAKLLVKWGGRFNVKQSLHIMKKRRKKEKKKQNLNLQKKFLLCCKPEIE